MEHRHNQAHTWHIDILSELPLIHIKINWKSAKIANSKKRFHLPLSLIQSQCEVFDFLE